MSDIVLVSLINGIVTLTGIALSRLMSHREHRANHEDIQKIMNGNCEHKTGVAH